MKDSPYLKSRHNDEISTRFLGNIRPVWLIAYLASVLFSLILICCFLFIVFSRK